MKRVATADVPCPHCGRRQSRVVDSEGTRSGSVRRRRVCSCGKRYTTYEHLGRDPKTIMYRLNKIELLLEELQDDLGKPASG